jgi:regulator of replication initiation timing
VTRAERRKNPDYRIAELEAEVERLQKATQEMALERKGLLEENERLRAEVDEHKRWYQMLPTTHQQQFEENARLRGENSDLIARIDRYYEDGHRAATEEMQDEVERLQSLLLRQTQLNEEAFKDIDLLRARVQDAQRNAEIWRKRADEHGRLNTRYRKAVNWLRGALHDESPSRLGASVDRCEVWECIRARAVLEEEKGE